MYSKLKAGKGEGEDERGRIHPYVCMYVLFYVSLCYVCMYMYRISPLIPAGFLPFGIAIGIAIAIAM